MGLEEDLRLEEEIGLEEELGLLENVRLEDCGARLIGAAHVWPQLSKRLRFAEPK